MGVHIQKFKKSFTITYIYALKAPRACRICGSLQWLGREEMRNSYDENYISNSMFGVEKKKWWRRCNERRGRAAGFLECSRDRLKEERAGCVVVVEDDVGMRQSTSPSLEACLPACKCRNRHALLQHG